MFVPSETWYAFVPSVPASSHNVAVDSTGKEYNMRILRKEDTFMLVADKTNELKYPIEFRLLFNDIHEFITLIA